jgi:hypothetical protein
MLGPALAGVPFPADLAITVDEAWATRPFVPVIVQGAGAGAGAGAADPTMFTRGVRKRDYLPNVVRSGIRSVISTLPERAQRFLPAPDPRRLIRADPTLRDELQPGWRGYEPTAAQIAARTNYIEFEAALATVAIRQDPIWSTRGVVSFLMEDVDNAPGGRIFESISFVRNLAALNFDVLVNGSPDMVRITREIYSNAANPFDKYTYDWFPTFIRSPGELILAVRSRSSFVFFNPLLVQDRAAYSRLVPRDIPTNYEYALNALLRRYRYTRGDIIPAFFAEIPAFCAALIGKYKMPLYAALPDRGAMEVTGIDFMTHAPFVEGEEIYIIQREGGPPSFFKRAPLEEWFRSPDVMDLPWLINPQTEEVITVANISRGIAHLLGPLPPLAERLATRPDRGAVPIPPSTTNSIEFRDISNGDPLILIEAPDATGANRQYPFLREGLLPWLQQLETEGRPLRNPTTGLVITLENLFRGTAQVVATGGARRRRRQTQKRGRPRHPRHQS